MAAPTIIGVDLARLVRDNDALRLPIWKKDGGAGGGVTAISLGPFEPLASKDAAARDEIYVVQSGGIVIRQVGVQHLTVGPGGAAIVPAGARYIAWAADGKGAKLYHVVL